MNDYTEWVLGRGVGKSLLVDTNLFLLFVVGSYSRRTITKFKRTSGYSESDYRELVRIIDRFLPHGRTLTTPHVLTEVSNLAGQASGDVRAGLLRTLARIVPRLREEPIPAADLVEHGSFVPFGLTDCGILELTAPNSIVLTDDLLLAKQLELRSRPVLNFSHIRIERVSRR